MTLFGILKRFDWEPISVIAVLLVAVMMIVLGLAILPPEPKFADGRITRLRLGLERGRVIGHHCRPGGCRYDIRFCSDRDLVMGVQEFELVAATPLDTACSPSR